MKKFISLLLACAMVFSIAACDSTTGTTPAEVKDRAVKGTLTIGDSTELNSDFISGFSNIAANATIKSLIHGYDTMGLTPYAEYVIDPVVVKDYDIAEHADGSKTYTFTINDNLTWNEGTPITALDYVFAILWRSSPQFDEIDGNALAGYYYIGYEDFYNGDTRTFTGVNLIDEYTFSVTVPAENFPNYYEMVEYAAIGPNPMFVIAPDVTITDDGSGATISDNFTTDLLRETVLDPVNGYRYNPKVTAGAYNFTSFDAAAHTAIVTANPLYLGTYDGYKASIQRIVYKFVVSGTQMVELESGSIDLVPQVTSLVDIEAGLDLVDRGGASYHTFERNGYGKIAFHCDRGPAQFKAVRQAVAWLLDREEFVRQFSGGYAAIIDSVMATTQWVYVENKEYLDDTLTHYTLNAAKAVEVLEADGWTLNASGGKFTPGTDKVRYKMVDGELMELRIEWLSSTGNEVSDILRVLLVPEAEKIGMIINETAVTSVINDYYRLGIKDEDAVYMMFNLGTGFGIPHTPWDSYQFSDRQWWGGNYNNNFIEDKDLEDLVLNMRATDPEDRDGYGEKWLELLVMLNELMPDIPLYCNTYFDFYNAKLKDFSHSSVWPVADALIRAYVE